MSSYQLHTGERPHTCIKCGRGFQRGDALARHSKGPGGCSGRRASFGGDDESGAGDDGIHRFEYDVVDEFGPPQLRDQAKPKGEVAIPSSIIGHDQALTEPKDSPTVFDEVYRSTLQEEAKLPQPVLDYLNRVKAVGGDDTKLYDQFVELMIEFQSGKIDTPGVRDRVSQLLRDNRELRQEVDMFLYPGYEIEDVADDGVVVLTTHLGGEAMPDSVFGPSIRLSGQIGTQVQSPSDIQAGQQVQTLITQYGGLYNIPTDAIQNLPTQTKQMLLLQRQHGPGDDEGIRAKAATEELDSKLGDSSALMPTSTSSAKREPSSGQLDPFLGQLEENGNPETQWCLPGTENDPSATVGELTDSGYQSMTKQGHSETDGDDADSNADSVRTDNRESGLPQNVKEQLSTYFAQEILDSIQLAKDELSNAIDEICSSLPELLREFSTLVEIHARPGLEERACIFVRHQRNQIARNLRTILLSKPDSSDAPAARDRIDLLWGEHHNIDDDPDDRVMADLAHEIKDPSDNPLSLPEIPEARAYLIESSEYRWLLSRIQSIVKTMPTLSTDSEVRRDLIGVIGGGRTIKVGLNWHLASFLGEQYENPEDVKLQQVLCCSGLVDNAYVAPSAEYADLLWPRLGKEMILYLSRSLRKGSIRTSGMCFEISQMSCS